MVLRRDSIVTYRKTLAAARASSTARNSQVARRFGLKLSHSRGTPSRVSASATNWTPIGTRHALQRGSRATTSQVVAGNDIMAARTLAVRGVSFQGQKSRAELPNWGSAKRITAKRSAAAPIAAEAIRTELGTMTS